MKLTVLYAMVFAIVFIELCDGQRSRGRNRGRNRSRGDQQCHLKEIDSCLDKIQSLAKGPNPTAIITTASGVDKICGSFNDVVKCVKTYFRKCGTPLQRELYEFVTEYFVQMVKQFCTDGPLRQNFLKNSPCIHNKVLSTNQYKTNCNNNYLAAVDHVLVRNKTDDRHDTMCCGHNTWEDCTDGLIGQHCGAEGQKSFKTFIDKAFGGITTMLCPRAVFPPTGNICKKALPPKGTRPKGKIGDNPISKYISSYFSFLFATN